MALISVLFARRDSVYKTMGLDVWDADRDVRNYRGTNPVICHPPCRIWGSFQKYSLSCGNYDPMEHLWPWWCKDLVDSFGGVIEHPIASRFWKKVKPTIVVDQWWFGHRARKRTGLYINGTIPAFPFLLGKPEYVVASSRGNARRIAHAEREHTPRDFAEWLVECVKRP